MKLVSANEKVLYRWESEKEDSDSIVVTDKRFYHSDSGKNPTHTCINVNDVKMVKSNTKKIKRKKTWWRTLLKVLLSFSALNTILLIIDSIINPDFTEEPLVVLATLSIILMLALFFTKYKKESVMEIEYITGNKVDIVMTVNDEIVTYRVRDAIFTAIDEQEKTL